MINIPQHHKTNSPVLNAVQGFPFNSYIHYPQIHADLRRPVLSTVEGAKQFTIKSLITNHYSLITKSYSLFTND
ncbi:MAG: hypothetical protein JXA96_09745 [Sedimentisphaerales bacterium]|nr:hypothetical protein [Sedimentisphaerales bacterium]